MNSHDKDPHSFSKACFYGVSLLVISACEPAPESNKNSMGNILGDTSSSLSQYTEVKPGYQLSFPEDHLGHNDFRQEWWYLTANMRTQSGENIGIQWTQFRIALSGQEAKDNSVTPVSVTDASQSQQLQQAAISSWEASPWATSQMYMSHAALTSNNSHQSAEKWSRSHPQFADVTANPFTVKLDDWQWISDSTELFPATLKVATDTFSYQLSLSSSAPMQLQGENGYSIKSADKAVASYYYSQPFIDVTGTITRNGKQEKVSGQAWLDREWSSQFLTKSQQGWDWFSLRLNQQQTLMVFQLRGTSSEEHFYTARLMNRDGSGVNLNSHSHPDDIKMTPIAWTTTALGKHPTQWKISINSQNIALTTAAINPVSDMGLSISYWEGPIHFTGSHSGSGYMELTGY